MIKTNNIPYLLVYLRLIFGPIMLVISFYFGKPANMAIFILMLIGLLSDIFDGIIERNLNVSSEKLRIADSRVDLIFGICAGISAFLLWPLQIIQQIELIILLFVMEGMCYVTSILKFKKSACTHSYLAKFWGITLFMSLANLILFGQTGPLFTLCVVVGVLANTEIIFITLILKEWTHDIPSMFHAVRIRQGKKITRYKLFNGSNK